jgi:hypothetical protein
MTTDETVHETPVDDADDVDDADPTVDPTVDEPRFWHRDHPVFTPLAGFFTGVLLVIVVGGLLGALLDLVLGYDVGEHPWVLLAAPAALLVVTLALLAAPRTRRFARYLLFGVVTTPAVISAAASLTWWLLLHQD